jgi:hypothetical protein
VKTVARKADIGQKGNQPVYVLISENAGVPLMVIEKYVK